MLRCAGRIATIIALCCAIGLHWIALQSVAWTTMVFALFHLEADLRWIDVTTARLQSLAEAVRA